MKKSSKIAFFSLLLTSVLLLGCRTIQTVPVQQTQNNAVKTEYIYRDSVIEKEKVVLRNDTVYVDREVEKVKYRTMRDTCFRVEYKEVPVEVPVPVEVEKIVKVAPKWIGVVIASILVLGIIIGVCFNILIKRIKKSLFLS